jgi:hypothetical protein
VKRVPESNSGLKRRLSFAQHLAKLEEVLPTKPQERSKGMEMIKRFARRVWRLSTSNSIPIHIITGSASPLNHAVFPVRDSEP